jgi:prepilin-type N-terminal cleavage/methylation domain-containing protein
LKRATGFTLLELTIVLAISTLVLVAATQLLGHMQYLETQQQKRAGELSRGVMEKAWASAVLSGLANDFPGVVNPARRFSGNPQSLQGYTTTALLANAGEPREIRLSMRPEAPGTLLYAERGVTGWDEAIPLIQAVGALRFEYHDRMGRTYPQWPQADGEQLPALIRLYVTAAEGEHVALTVHPLSSEVPRRDMTGQ